MTQYAGKTTVTSQKSRLEIEDTLSRYGATDFAYAAASGLAAVGFVANDRRVRFTLVLPDPESREFTYTPTGLRRAAEPAAAAYEQAVRQRWRALLLLVKAKLEAVESGIVEFEAEFFAHVVLPGGSTVYEQAAPTVELAYRENLVPLTFLALER